MLKYFEGRKNPYVFVSTVQSAKILDNETLKKCHGCTNALKVTYGVFWRTRWFLRNRIILVAIMATIFVNNRIRLLPHYLITLHFTSNYAKSLCQQLSNTFAGCG